MKVKKCGKYLEIIYLIQKKLEMKLIKKKEY